MAHSKAKVEYPEDLRVRVEDARKKMKATKDANPLDFVNAKTSSAKDNNRHSTLASIPDFECSLTILRQRSSPVAFQQHNRC